MTDEDGWLRTLEALLLPNGCSSCGRATDHPPFCRGCTPPPAPPVPVPPPRPLAAWTAEVAYTDAWKEWIHRFKYPGSGLSSLDPAADAVVLALVRAAARRVPATFVPDIVVPVPLHRARRRERGFDQAALLARAVAREARVKAGLRVLERRRDTPRQVGLSRRERRRNVRGAFVARRAVPACVWLVDDVATTGATLSEAARALLCAGAHQVIGICVAHTPPGRNDARFETPLPSG
ncbi:MAG: ComF family protein [Deltaproteobacteria bacterium]|nr:ComF family protein [Deltaproteobacteria bacterium]